MVQAGAFPPGCQEVSEQTLNLPLSSPLSEDELAVTLQG